MVPPGRGACKCWVGSEGDAGWQRAEREVHELRELSGGRGIVWVLLLGALLWMGSAEAWTAEGGAEGEGPVAEEARSSDAAGGPELALRRGVRAWMTVAIFGVVFLGFFAFLWGRSARHAAAGARDTVGIRPRGGDCDARRGECSAVSLQMDLSGRDKGGESSACGSLAATLHGERGQALIPASSLVTDEVLAGDDDEALLSCGHCERRYVAIIGLSHCVLDGYPLLPDEGGEWLQAPDERDELVHPLALGGESALPALLSWCRSCRTAYVPQVTHCSGCREALVLQVDLSLAMGGCGGICPQCSQRYPEGVLFCPHDGARLEALN